MTMMQSATQKLPDNAYYGPDGLLYHKITRMSEGGHEIEVYRRLALTIDEAREKRIDFYHPTYGLIWDGYKRSKDSSPLDIMADSSTGGFRPANGGPTLPGETR